MLRAFDAELQRFSPDKLNDGDALSYRLLKKAVADCLYGYRFRAWLMPVNLLEGPQVRMCDYVCSRAHRRFVFINLLRLAPFFVLCSVSSLASRSYSIYFSFPSIFVKLDAYSYMYPVGYFVR